MGIFGLAASAVGAGLGIASAIKNSEQQKKLAEEQRQNRLLYLEGVRQRAGADNGDDAVSENVIKRTADAIRERNRNAAGKNAVIGGTTEAQMAVTEANNEMMDKANQVNEQYLANKRQVNDRRVEDAERSVYGQQQAALAERQGELAKANSQAMGAVSSGLSGMMEGVDGIVKSKRNGGSIWD